ncbi:MAG: sulfate ABC transporter substrate-binding protein [Frankiaceae bacterium]|nr:sulfate ABC transporter substrate-binding protein [Frankiaceae bacterium]MBV9871388.1 sulfate ABC transporter substrate-binding protein [Frankiaceae bacterium]
MLTKKRIAAGAGLLAIAAVTGCGGGSSAGGSGGGTGAGGSIKLVAYSTPQKAYEELGPAFAKTPEGSGATIAGSYAASGTQRDKVLNGQPADVVEFSRSSDMQKLVDANLVPSTWDSNQYKGMVTDSVAVLIVRKGNPLGIKTWDDLVKPGVKVVTPNPLSSGSACWNLMAAYGAQLNEGKSDAEALAFVKSLLQHTVAQPASGSDSTAAFIGGTGNVLIGYENEAIAAQQAGDDVDYIIPDDTILIENPIAVTSNASNPTLANNFVKYLYTDAGQKIFASKGYRPVVAADLDKKVFPTPPGLFTIDKLGGWSEVNTKFFDTTNGSITKIENDLGRGASG